MRQSACLVINPITVDNFAVLFNRTSVDQVSDSMMALSALSSVATCRSTGAQLMILICLFGGPGISNRHATIVSVESSSLLLHSFKP